MADTDSLGNQMKKRALRWGSLLALAIGFAFLYDYFHVTGKEIPAALEISDFCTVTIAKYRLLEYNDRVEYTLDPDQTMKLRELILDSSFTRELASTVSFHDRDQYDIRIFWDDGTQPLILHSLGGEYLTVTNAFDGKHLKIENPSWKATLEEILADSPQEG